MFRILYTLLIQCDRKNYPFTTKLVQSKLERLYARSRRRYLQVAANQTAMLQP